MKKTVLIIFVLLASVSVFAEKPDITDIPIHQFGALGYDLDRQEHLTFAAFAATGGMFSRYSDEDLLGSINGAFGDFVMDQSGNNYTYCNDFTVLIANFDLTEVLVQLGGWDDVGGDYKFAWPEGNSTAAGPGGGLIEFGQEIDVTGYYLWLGNGYGNGGENSWTGSVDLYGSVVANGLSTIGAVKALFN